MDENGLTRLCRITFTGKIEIKLTGMAYNQTYTEIDESLFILSGKSKTGPPDEHTSD